MAPSRGRKLYPVKKNYGEETFLMRAGAAHGLLVGSRFNVYDEDIYREADTSIDRSPPLGSLVATFTDSFMTELVIPEDSPKFELRHSGRAWAMQTHTGEEEDLRVHIADDERLIGLFGEIYQRMPTHTNAKRVILVEKDTAELDVELDDSGQVAFNITNNLCVQYGLAVMPYTVPPTSGDLYPVIQSAAHFYWHLRRSNASEKQPLRDMVEVEVFELQERMDEWVDGFPLMHSPKDGAKNLNVANVVDMVADETLYGFNIKNKGHVDLYCSVFYFDISDLSISKFIISSVAGVNC